MEPAELLEVTDRFVTDTEAAARLGVSPGHLRNLRVRGDGPPFATIGRSVRYRLPVLMDWVERRTVTSTSEGRPFH